MLGNIKVYAFVGPSGTGKSYKSTNGCRRKESTFYY